MEKERKQKGTVIAKEVQKLMLANNWGQRELALASGVGQGTVSRILKRKQLQL